MDWISCEDRLPEEGEEVGYVFSAAPEEKKRGAAYKGIGIFDDVWFDYEDGRWKTYYYCCFRPTAIKDALNVTHWIPLPSPPKDIPD